MDFYKIGELATYTSIYSLAGYGIKTFIKDRISQRTMDALELIYYVGFMWVIFFLSARDIIYCIYDIHKEWWALLVVALLFIFSTIMGYYTGKRVVQKRNNKNELDKN